MLLLLFAGVGTAITQPVSIGAIIRATPMLEPESRVAENITEPDSMAAIEMIPKIRRAKEL